MCSVDTLLSPTEKGTGKREPGKGNRGIFSHQASKHGQRGGSDGKKANSVVKRRGGEQRTEAGGNGRSAGLKNTSVPFFYKTGKKTPPPPFPIIHFRPTHKGRNRRKGDGREKGTEGFFPSRSENARGAKISMAILPTLSGIGGRGAEK